MGNYSFQGVATTSTNPGTPIQSECYLAVSAGPYANFKDQSNVELIVAANQTCMFFYDTTNAYWTKTVIADKSVIGLDNVNNTSDADKPVSTAQAAVDTALQQSINDEATARENADTEINGDLAQTESNLSTEELVRQNADIILQNNIDLKAIEILPASVTPEKLSEATLQLIETAGGGSVTNLPDDEDLITSGNVLKFKDKAFQLANYSGLGRKYLRKNIDGGSGLNLLMQAMLPDANTIYLIQYDYDLNGITLNIPTGCELRFEGGSIENGTLVFRNTTLSGNVKIDGSTVSLETYSSSEGIYNNQININWFGVNKTTDSDDTLIIQKLVNLNQQKSIFFPAGTYRLSKCVISNDYTTLIGDGLSTNLAYKNAIDDSIVTFISIIASQCIVRDLFLTHVSGALDTVNMLKIESGKSRNSLLNLRVNATKFDYGIYVAGSDCVVNDIEVNWAKIYGYYVYTSGLLGSNWKVTRCGTGIGLYAGGGCLSGVRSLLNTIDGINMENAQVYSISNIETQENGRHGILIKNSRENTIGLNTLANNTDVDTGYGIKFEGTNYNNRVYGNLIDGYYLDKGGGSYWDSAHTAAVHFEGTGYNNLFELTYSKSLLYTRQYSMTKLFSGNISVFDIFKLNGERILPKTSLQVNTSFTEITDTAGIMSLSNVTGESVTINISDVSSLTDSETIVTLISNSNARIKAAFPHIISALPRYCIYISYTIEVVSDSANIYVISGYQTSKDAVTNNAMWLNSETLPNVVGVEDKRNVKVMLIPYAEGFTDIAHILYFSVFRKGVADVNTAEVNISDVKIEVLSPELGYDIFNSATEVKKLNTRIDDLMGIAVPDISNVDATDLVTVITLANANKAKINALLAAMRTAGLIST